jgi:hypothetical protein
MRPAKNIVFFAYFRLRRSAAAQSRACITFTAICFTVCVESITIKQHAYGTLMD